MSKNVFLTIISILIILSGCGAYEQKSTILVKLNNESTTQKDIINSNTSTPADAKEIVISVFEYNANGELLFRKSYSPKLEVAEIKLEAGNSRFFVMEAKDRNGLTTYKGDSETAIDLTAGETATVSISMEKIEMPTATVNITLQDATSSFEINSAPELLNDQVQISIITLNSPIFDNIAEDDFEISCSDTGDYIPAGQTDEFYNATDFPSGQLSLTVPAQSFLIIAVRGYADISGIPATRIRYYGLASPSSTSNLLPDSNNDVVITLSNGYTGDSSVDSNWEQFCLCE